MQFLKTFTNGRNCAWQIEDAPSSEWTIPQPIAYVEGVRAGVIWECLNLDDDGNPKPPQVVDGKTLVAYVRHEDKIYWLVDDEFEPLRQAREAARKSKAERQSAEWRASPEGRKEIERRRLEQEWDAVHNEGGDGYNPHRPDDDLSGTAFHRRERHNPEGA